jgi:hypothetical protein
MYQKGKISLKEVWTHDGFASHRCLEVGSEPCGKQCEDRQQHSLSKPFKLGFLGICFYLLIAFPK